MVLETPIHSKQGVHVAEAHVLQHPADDVRAENDHEHRFLPPHTCMTTIECIQDAFRMHFLIFGDSTNAGHNLNTMDASEHCHFLMDQAGNLDAP